MPKEKVTLVHPDLKDQPIVVSQSAAKTYALSGWRPAKSQQPEPAKS